MYYVKLKLTDKTSKYILKCWLLCDDLMTDYEQFAPKGIAENK